MSKWNDLAWEGPPTHRRLVSRSVKMLQALAWIVGFAIFIPWHSVFTNVSKPKPTLTAEQVAEATDFIKAKIAKVERLGTAYTAVEFVRDQAELANVRSRLALYRGPEPALTVAQKRATSAVSWVYEKAHEALVAQLKETNPDIDSQLLASSARSTLSGVIGTRTEIYNKFRPSFLPEGRESTPINWGRAGRRYLTAWLLTLIPAFVGILLRMRAGKVAILPEFVLRPWEPVLATIFWWYGLNEYPGGLGAVEREFERLKWRFQHQHQRWPDEIETARLLVEARGPMLSFGAALRQVQEMPELVRVRSHRAMFAAMVLATLGAPFQLLATVSTVMAQTTRMTSGNTPVPTDTVRTRKEKTPNGELWGYFQGKFSARNRTFDLAAARVKGRKTLESAVVGERRVSVEGELNLKTGRLNTLNATVPVANGLSLTTGQVVNPIVDDFTPPHKSLVLWSPLYDLAPPFYDLGVVAKAERGGSKFSVAALNGNGTGGDSDHRLSFAARGEQRADPVTLSASCHIDERGSGQVEQRYVAGLLTFRHRYGRFELAHAARSDLDKDASTGLAVITSSAGILGVQVERPKGLRLGVERPLGGKNRILLNFAAHEKAKPSWELLLQTAFTFAQ